MEAVLADRVHLPPDCAQHAASAGQRPVASVGLANEVAQLISSGDRQRSDTIDSDIHAPSLYPCHPAARVLRAGAARPA